MPTPTKRAPQKVARVMLETTRDAQYIPQPAAPEIPQQLTYLANSMDELDTSVEELAKRLHPVMRNQVAGAEPVGNSPTVSACEFGGRLQALLTRLHTITSTVRGMTDALQV